MAQQRRQTNEFGLAFVVVIFTICEIPARKRDGVLISMKLRRKNTWSYNQSLDEVHASG